MAKNTTPTPTLTLTAGWAKDAAQMLRVLAREGQTARWGREAGQLQLLDLHSKPGTNLVALIVHGARVIVTMNCDCDWEWNWDCECASVSGSVSVTVRLTLSQHRGVVEEGALLRNYFNYYPTASKSCFALHSIHLCLVELPTPLHCVVP